MRNRHLGLTVVSSLVLGAWIATGQAIAAPKEVVGATSHAKISAPELADGGNVLDAIGNFFGGSSTTQAQRSKSRHRSPPATGRIDATIKDNSGSPMSGVLVTLTPKAGQNNGFPIVQVSNDNGQIRFLALAPGRWTLTASRDEFSTLTYDFRVRGGRIVTLAVRLDPVPYSFAKKGAGGTKKRAPARTAVKRTRARPSLNPVQRRAIKALRAEEIETSELLRLARIAKIERRSEDFKIIMDELRSRRTRLVFHDAPPISVQDFVNFIADFITPPDIGEAETVSTFGPHNEAEYEKLRRRARVHRAAGPKIEQNSSSAADASE